MSQEVLAHLLGRSKSWLTKVERGERQLDRVSVIAELARVLRVDVAELTGQPLQPDAGLPAPAALPAIRRALIRPEAGRLDEAAAAGVDDLPTLRSRMLQANRLRHAGNFDALAALLPSLLEDVQVAAVVARPGPELQAALELVVDACHCARMLLKALGYLDLAWIATDRGRDAAERLGDPLLLAASAWNRAEVHLGSGDVGGAVELALAAIDRLGGERGVAQPERLSLLGMLHLKAAYGRAGAGDERQARVHLAEADAAASLLGADRNDFGTLFGPTNVVLHRIGVAMELSLPGEAVRLARSLSGTRMAPERRVRLAVDLARAHAQLRREREAMRLLMESQRIAPRYLRGHPLAHDMVAALLPHAPRTAAAEMRVLASHVGGR
jgi:transcriptional regulator with XRE-family HTH domain